MEINRTTYLKNNKDCFQNILWIKSLLLSIFATYVEKLCLWNEIFVILCRVQHIAVQDGIYVVRLKGNLKGKKSYTCAIPCIFMMYEEALNFMSGLPILLEDCLDESEEAIGSSFRFKIKGPGCLILKNFLPSFNCNAHTSLETKTKPNYLLLSFNNSV